MNENNVCRENREGEEGNNVMTMTNTRRNEKFSNIIIQSILDNKKKEGKKPTVVLEQLATRTREEDDNGNNFMISMDLISKQIAFRCQFYLVDDVV
jgi:hypothetical protein